MDEEIEIIGTNTRNEKIKNFFINNKKALITTLSIILILLISFFTLGEITKRNKIKIANQFNLVIINYKNAEKSQTITKLTDIIKKQDVTYSPLALYFLIDNNLIDQQNEINALFDILINMASLKKEIKNLIIYKKALYNSDLASENELISILKPIIASESIWKSHSLYLLAEYFYYKNEKLKAKEFFNQILTLTNSNNEIKLKTQKRINRDFSE
jgi:predicted negative regulator of RcsB-dependent stress response